MKIRLSVKEKKKLPRGYRRGCSGLVTTDNNQVDIIIKKSISDEEKANVMFHELGHVLVTALQEKSKHPQEMTDKEEERLVNNFAILCVRAFQQYPQSLPGLIKLITAYRK